MRACVHENGLPFEWSEVAFERRGLPFKGSDDLFEGQAWSPMPGPGPELPP